MKMNKTTFVVKSNDNKIRIDDDKFLMDYQLFSLLTDDYFLRNQIGIIEKYKYKYTYINICNI